LADVAATLVAGAGVDFAVDDLTAGAFDRGGCCAKAESGQLAQTAQIVSRNDFVFIRATRFIQGEDRADVSAAAVAKGNQPYPFFRQMRL
jgi:hypothetical protein